jgi:hypothetical protein
MPVDPYPLNESADKTLVAACPIQADYVPSGESRPVLQADLTAQLADFVPDPEQGGQP